MKRAIAVSTLVAIIISIIGFIVLLSFTTSLLIKSNESFHDQICSYSVALHSISAGNVGIKCPSKIVNIKPTGVTVMGHTKRVLIDKKYLAKFDSSQFNEAVAYILSDQMYRCWDMFGRGGVDILSSELLTENQYCIACADIKFSKDNDGRTVSGLDTYMAQHSVAKGGESMTYSQFLGYNLQGEKATIVWQPVFSSSHISSPGTQTEQNVYTSKEYTIVFMGLKYSYLERLLGKLVITPWNKEGVYVVHIIPKDEIAKSCSYIYN